MIELIFSYPLVFIVCILPNTISRWLQFGGTKPPHQFSLFANTVFALSGAFNLILFILTRPRVVLGPGSPQQEAYEMKGDDVSSVEDMETGAHRRESTTSTAVSASQARVTHRTSAGGIALRKNQLPQRPGTHIEEDYEDETADYSQGPHDIQRVSRQATPY